MEIKAGIARIATVVFRKVAVVVTFLTLLICVAVLTTLISVSKYVRKVNQVASKAVTGEATRRSQITIGVRLMY